MEPGDLNILPSGRHPFEKVESVFFLNTQIPKEEDWHKWDVNAVDARAVLKLLLDE